MNLLLIAEIVRELPVPAFGAALQAHIDRKRHPDVHASALTAWNLLALGMRKLGYETLPEVFFHERGKPAFRNSPLHFSLSHSGLLAAVLLSPDACAVDVEMLRPDVPDRLRRRCMSPGEIAAGHDFFTCWTRKECIAKLDGGGLPSCPCETDAFATRYENAFSRRELTDSEGRNYLLTALCVNEKKPQIQKIMPEELF